MSRTFPVGPIPTPIFEVKTKTEMLVVLEKFDEFITKFVVVKALDAYKFPWTSHEFAEGPVPTPMFEVTASENAFIILETLRLVVNTLPVVSAFDAYRFPGG
jgi:hypothetical protein